MMAEPESDDMMKIMGFSTFGDKKKARNFDFMEMFNEARKTASERNEKQKDSGTNVDDNSQIGPSLSQFHSSDDITPLAGSNQDGCKVIDPQVPVDANNVDDDVDSDSDDESTGQGQSLDSVIPNAEHVVMQHGDKTISALDLDGSGARLVSGGTDYDIKLWNFAGMDSSLSSFRTLRPCESHPINFVQFDPTSKHLLVVSGNAQAVVLDRDAYKVMECPKGYPYISDPGSNKGHTSMLNCGAWHPRNEDQFMTCSYDCSLRIWEMSEAKKSKHVIKPKGSHGRKIVPTSCCYSRDGELVLAACQDGSIMVWDHRKHFVNTCLLNRHAHENGADISSICCSYDNKMLVSRSMDDTVKLWDLRSFSKPLHAATDLSNRFSFANASFSPNDNFIITSVSATSRDSDGTLIFLDRVHFNKTQEITFPGTDVVRHIWHPKINQIAVSTSRGTVEIFYDPERSHNGVKCCTLQRRAKSHHQEYVSKPTIYAPISLRSFRQEREKSTREHERKLRKDPLKSKRPDLPVTGPGSAGRIGLHGATLSQYVMKSIAVHKKEDPNFDVREAILRHDGEAQKDPFWTGGAYDKSQPAAIFEDLDTDGKEVDEKLKLKSFWKKPKLDQ